TCLTDKLAINETFTLTLCGWFIVSDFKLRFVQLKDLPISIHRFEVINHRIQTIDTNVIFHVFIYDFVTSFSNYSWVIRVGYFQFSIFRKLPRKFFTEEVRSFNYIPRSEEHTSE